jgi:MFS family permease
MSSPESRSGLDYLSFFVAGIQTGFGAFIAVFLTGRGWTQTEIGVAFSAAGIAGLVGQLPGGMLIDATRGKRGLAAASILAIAGGAILLVTWPRQGPVVFGLVLQSLASCVLGPAIAAISLALAGNAMLGERLGRNTRYASIGNGIAAGAMGMLGTFVSESAVFWLTAVLALPALRALWQVGTLPAVAVAGVRKLPTRDELRALLTDRRLVIFGIACALFHLANGAMAPLAAAHASRAVGRLADLLVGASIVAPTIVVALVSLWLARMADMRGRRVVLLLGWGILPLRAILLALLPSQWLLPFVQALGGVCDAVFGIMMPLVCADITRGTGRFNLCLAVMSLMMVLGATLSTTLAGMIADQHGVPAAFVAMALVGLAGVALIWLALPETRTNVPGAAPD